MPSFRSASDEIDVCLVSPPFDTLRFPPLGPAVVVSALRARGLRVKALYGSIMLGSRIGYDAYMAICAASPNAQPLGRETESQNEMLGERLFRPHAYPAKVAATLPACDRLPPDAQRLYDLIAPAIALFLDEMIDGILGLGPRIVGISSTFQQNLAAAAIARLIKQKAPDICVVLGGANVSSPMGHGLARVFPWIDHFFAGEADTEFPDFCERLVETGSRPDTRVIECAPVRDMREVAMPDFADYFECLREAQSRGALPAGLPRFLSMESSRGCWWGAKHHCTFCGLNGETMDFRSKPADRVLDEIRNLASRWKAKRIFFADNIMPLSYFGDLFPTLAAWEERPTLFFEAKANLRDDQLDLLAGAGVTGIQPGIESFSSNVLRLMRKGISGLQNLALLRSCRSVGITVTWNYLYGFPGEATADYEAVPLLIPKIEHLEPPLNCEPVIIDRFSPYQKDPKRFGIASISPYKAYQGLYPAGAPLSDIAYHFTGEYSTPVLACRELLARLHGAVGLWKAQWGPGSARPILQALDIGADGVVIADTRRIAKYKTTAISRAMDAALRFFERPRQRDRLDDVTGGHVDYLLDKAFLIEHEGQLLSVVTRKRSFMPLRVPAAEAGVAVDCEPMRLSTERLVASGGNPMNIP